LVSSTNNLVGPLFFLGAFGFLEATGIGSRLLGSGLAVAGAAAFLPKVFWQMQVHCSGEEGAPIFFQI
jgi:hypothetical protein